MMSNPNILAIIPARGNSRRLPGKNIKLLDNRPLIAYSILLAKSLELVSDVVVASDSEEIRFLSSEQWVWSYNPTPNAVGDMAPLSQTLQESLEWYTGIDTTRKPDWVILLQPTCPLRLPSLCNRWISQVLNDPNCDGLLTVDKDSYKLGSVLGVVGDGYFWPQYEPMTPKQSVRPQLRENGVFYVFKAENVLKGKPWDSYSKMIPVECPRAQSLANIDTQADWDIAEWLYWTRGYDKVFRELEGEVYAG